MRIPGIGFKIFLHTPRYDWLYSQMDGVTWRYLEKAHNHGMELQHKESWWKIIEGYYFGSAVEIDLRINIPEALRCRVSPTWSALLHGRGNRKWCHGVTQWCWSGDGDVYLRFIPVFLPSHDGSVANHDRLWKNIGLLLIAVIFCKLTEDLELFPERTDSQWWFLLFCYPLIFWCRCFDPLPSSSVRWEISSWSE